MAPRKVVAALMCLVAYGCLGFSALDAPVAAGQAHGHALDAVLSLTGDCETDLVDNVPDPGPCPGVTGSKEADHPPKKLNKPCGTVTDDYGDIYVASVATDGGRIDVFNAKGEFFVEFEDKGHASCGLAVDSEGNVYTGGIETGRIIVYKPSEFPPTPKTDYALSKEIKLFAEGCLTASAIAIDLSDDHLYISSVGCEIREYGSAAEGWPLLGEFQIPKEEMSKEGGKEVSAFLSGIDVYGKDHDIYAAVKTQTSSGSESLPSRVYVFDGGDGHVKCEILGAEAPGDLDFGLGASLAVDQSNGDAYIYSVTQKRVYHFAVAGEDECGFVDTLPEPFPSGEEPLGDIAVDAPLEAGEPNYKSPNNGHVFVTSGLNPAGSHLFAFKPRNVGPPQIENQAAAGIAETEAVLQAELNPGSLETTYHFEYVTQAGFEAAGYAGATQVPVPEASAGSGGAFIDVSVPITGLLPDTAYRFRLVATNCAAEEADPEKCLTIGEGNPGGGGTDASFVTYPQPPIAKPCPNEAQRTGPSAALPDCRAYELVTPPDTGGHIPTTSMVGRIGFGDINFATQLASPDGLGLLFGSNSGALPGIGGGGGYDSFEARRGVNGWQSHFTGMTGAQAEKPIFGGISADHRCAFWNVENNKGVLGEFDERRIYLGCLPPPAASSPNCAVEGEPEGRFEWLACGSLGFAQEAAGKWISPGGGHVIFVTGFTGGGQKAVQLEEDCPPDGVRAIYDRTPGGPTRCISVPPEAASAETEAQFEQQDAIYGGTSADGSAVAFRVAGTLYARLDNATTVEVATGSPAFAGFSADGSRAFYLAEPSVGTVRRGEIYACEVALGPCSGPAATQEPTQIGAGGESVVVNISADGSHVYFVSPELLDGEAGEEGKDNLYVWDGNAVHFVALLDPLDLGVVGGTEGLGFWVGRVIASESQGPQGPGDDPSRSTPEGSVLVFQSHAELTGQPGGGHWQVFRYDSGAAPAEQLTCLSCNPTGTPPSDDAVLQVLGGDFLHALPPTTGVDHTANLSADGGKAFFQSTDRLVAADLDGKLDVYEWEAEGVEGCGREGGCLALISGPRSLADEYLYAATPDGRDVFFLSGDSLLSADPDVTPSIYDAREDGGFAEPPPLPGECLGEACQPAVAPPDDPTPASSGFEGRGDPVQKRGKRRGRCATKRLVRIGKRRCAHKHAKKNKQGKRRAAQ